MLENLSLMLIHAYQNYVRILLPGHCRFVPNCSEYAKEAILKYGFYRGIFKAGKRLLACHPWSGKAGYDPV